MTTWHYIRTGLKFALLSISDDSPHLHHKLYGQTAGRGQIACMGYLQFSIEYASVLNGGGRTQSSAIVHSYHDRTVYANCE